MAATGRGFQSKVTFLEASSIYIQTLLHAFLHINAVDRLILFTVHTFWRSCASASYGRKTKSLLIVQPQALWHGCIAPDDLLFPLASFCISSEMPERNLRWFRRKHMLCRLIRGCPKSYGAILLSFAVLLSLRGLLR
jgi:hypothetical protein